MIRIAQAASSEKGTEYGSPPNQLRTGVTADKPYGNLDGELNIIPFYPSGWKAVFRAKDERIAEKIADLAERCVKNWKGVGYGQNMTGSWNTQRTGLFDALMQMANPDPLMITTPVNCDCSAKTGACVYFAGVYEPKLRTMNTTSEPDVLMGTGAFIRLEDGGLLELGEGCKRGDIYWRYGHTMICLDTSDEQETTPLVIGNCSACHFRSGPSKYDSSLGILHPGDIVFKHFEKDGWSCVTWDGEYGYTSNKFLCNLPKAIVTGNVWMRDKPGYDWKRNPVGEKIIVIQEGTNECYLTGKKQTHMGTVWYECAYANEIGWASGMYVKEAK